MRVLESSENVIIPCPYSKNCGSCVSSKCMFCFDGYISDHKCVPVSTKLEGCKIYKSETDCQNCDYGYYLVDGKCVKITLPDCLGTSNNESCVVCVGKVENFVCTKKPCLLEGCKSCVDYQEEEKCQICDADYVLNYDDLTCRKKDPKNKGCVVYFGDKCSGCQHGYYDNLNTLSANCVLAEDEEDDGDGDKDGDSRDFIGKINERIILGIILIFFRRE